MRRTAMPLMALALTFSVDAAAQTGESSPDAVENWHLSRAGLKPLINGDGSEVQRFYGAINLLAWPAVELRRTSSGVTVTISYLGNSLTVPAREADWNRLSVMSLTALQPLSARQVAAARRRLRGASCHGVSARIEAGRSGTSRRLSFDSCSGEITRPALRYAEALAEVALNAIEDCRALPRSSGALMALNDCAGSLNWKITPDYAALIEARPYPTRPD